MTEQYEVQEIQNASCTPWVYRVGEGQGEYATVEEAELAAKAKYFTIMAAACVSQVAYHGANLIHMVGKNQILEKGEIIEREVSA